MKVSIAFIATLAAVLILPTHARINDKATLENDYEYEKSELFEEQSDKDLGIGGGPLPGILDYDEAQAHVNDGGETEKGYKYLYEHSKEGVIGDEELLEEESDGISARSITPRWAKTSSYLQAPLYFAKNVNFPFDSFYTPSYAFAHHIIIAGWEYKYIAARVSLKDQPGLTPLYNYQRGPDNFFTISEVEGLHSGYNYIGITCFVSATPQDGLVPFKRYFNPGTGDHFYTTGHWPNGGQGYFYEGTAAYVAPP